jgi:trehalose 6-phosphate synthase/phosphatase
MQSTPPKEKEKEPRVLAVMHQVPWTFKETANKITFELKRSHHSQILGTKVSYVGAEALKTDYEVIWVGWASREHSENVKDAFWKEKQAALVELPLDDSIGHYDGYCKSTLWPLFHYVLWDHATDGTAENKNWYNYVNVNKAFAAEILKIYQPGDIIWIQDYHLMMLPSILRKHLPDTKIGFFLHTPFPSSEIFRCLSRRNEILKGVLGADIVGFQTYSYARHFISSCTRVLGCESSTLGITVNGIHVQIGIFPIGINLKRVESIM